MTQVSLTLPRLDPVFDGFRLAQISDFHIGTWLDRQHLAEAVDRVNDQEPDFVAITGDLVTYRPSKFEAALTEELSRLNAKEGVGGVLGNHDHWSDPVIVRRILRQANVRDLSNTVHTLRRGQACLHIAGVDDYMDNLARLDRVLKQLPELGAAVLLAHEPDFAEISARTGRFDLQISGHSHGGQVVLPIIGAPILPQYSHKYPSGLYRVKGMFQYTNRGLGTAEIPFRWNCTPEITIFTFRAPSL